jgi:hypothetical protein
MHRFVLFIYSSIHIVIELCGKDVDFASNSNYDDPSKLVLSRTTLSFIGNLLLSLQFQTRICLAHSHIKRHGKVSFQTCVLFLKNSNTIFKANFQYLLHQFTSHFFSMNLNSIQFKVHCNVVHTSISYRNELISLASRTFEKKSCFAKNFFSYFLMLLVLVQIRNIYCMLHIT